MKLAIQWLNEVAEAVSSDMFAPSHPPGQAVLELIQRIQNDAVGAHETAALDRSVICQLGEMLIGTGKQCYSAEAVLRAVKQLKNTTRIHYDN